MNCQDVQAQLSDYLDCSRSAARLALVEEHLAACSPCREEAELLGESIREIAALPVLDAPLGFPQRVMSHVRDEETQPSFWQRFLPLSGKLPIQATAVVIVGFLGIYLLQKEQPQQQRIVAPEATAGSSAGQDSAQFTAGEPSAPKTAVAPQSSPARSNPQVPLSRQQTKLSSREEEISSRVEAPAPPPPAKDSAPDPSLSQSAETEVAVRATPVVSGLPTLTAPAPTSGGATMFPQLPDSDIPALRTSPAAIEPFADLELVLRRHTAPAKIDSSGPVRKPDLGQAGARPIERLMAAIPDHTRPQTIWINVPENQYEYFKTELYIIGSIESESRVPMLREQPIGHADGQIRVKLTALPAAEAALPDPPTGR
jgi:Putative zinc-finger